jgi:hypothetical protein
MLEARTFGGTPAAIKLAEIINEKNLPHYKVGRFLSSFNLTLSEIGKIDTRVSINIAKMVYIQFCSKTEDFPDEIKTFVRNLISTKFKIWLKEQNSKVPYNIRKNLSK